MRQAAAATLSSVGAAATLNPSRRAVLERIGALPLAVKAQRLVRHFEFRRAASVATPLPISPGESERRALLRKIYNPLFGGLARDTAAFDREARSGRAWAQHFKPFDTDPDRVWAEQPANARALQEITTMQSHFSDVPLQMLSLATRNAIAHQSAQIEGSQLTSGETLRLYRAMEVVSENFDRIDQLPPTASDLVRDCTLRGLEMPAAGQDGSPRQRDMQEFCNLVVAHEYVLHTLARRSDPNFTIEDMEHVHSLLFRTAVAYTRPPPSSVVCYDVRDTVGRIRTGGAEQMVRSAGAPLTIYPYPREVPQLMHELMLYKDESLCQFAAPSTTRTALNPHHLTFFARFYCAFLHIHPFMDGNGRVGRVFTALLMLRYGWTPMRFQSLNRMAYIRALQEATGSKRPDAFLQLMLGNVWDTCFAIAGDTPTAPN